MRDRSSTSPAKWSSATECARRRALFDLCVMSVVRVAQFLVDVICAWQCCAEKQNITGGDAATPAVWRTLVTADEAVDGEVELAEAQTAERSLGFERTLHGFVSP